MSNIQTGAERMPHDLSHLGFLAGQIGRLITISTTPVIAGDSFEMDAVGALRLSPLRRGLAIDSTVDIFTFYVPHRHVYGEQWIKFMKDGVNATPLPTVNTTGYIDHAAFLGTINPDTNKIPKHLFQGYLNIYNNYFKAPWMLVLNLPFKALMFLTLMRPSLVLFLVLWLKLVKDFLKVRCRLALLPFLISCLIWLDLVASLPLIKERILVIILLLHFLSLMLGSVLVLMLPLLVWLTPDLRIKKSLLKCNWTIRKRLPRCKMRLKKRLLAFSRRLHARIRKTRYMHKMRCLLINRRSLLLALRLLWKTPIFPSNSRFPRLCAKCLLKLKRLVSILPMTKSKK